jgi:hypothetical protein
MNALQRTTTAALRTAARPTLSRRMPALARFESSVNVDTAIIPTTESQPVKREGGADALPKHQLDYGVTQDYRTS